MPTAVAKRVVWVVDDSPLDAERARRVLSDSCSVEVFGDGSAALERLATATRAPDVMVLDWVMPGITGIEVCRFLRSAQGGQQQVGILLLTTHRHTEQIVEGLSAGANDYLAKPYEDTELHARVESLLRARHMLERAEEAEELSLKLLQMAPDALIALDERRQIRFFNQVARGLLQSRGELGVGVPIAQLLPELDLRPNERSNSTLHLPDLKLGERLYSPSMRTLPAGRLFDTILSLRDVTESRHRDARRLDFYSIIAHDLRSPLNTLTLRTQLILGGKHGVLPEGLSSDLQKMEKNIQSLVAMINDFLDLARLDNAAFELQMAQVDLEALLAEIMTDARPSLEAKKLHWVAESSGSPMIIGDSRRLAQVLTNLIGNAVKFTQDDGTITTRIKSQPGAVEVSVSDTGRGIAKDKLATVFERYTRASSHQDEVPGTGLGLMIVREIVAAHGGSVGVESTLGVGSRFWFRLPLAS